MIITERTIQQLLITDADRLDPIRVMWEDIEPGKGRIIITCWTSAWTGYWGAMGADLRVFFMAASVGYLVKCMRDQDNPGLKRRQRHEEEYLGRIIRAVQEAFRQHVRNELHGSTSCAA